MIKAEVLDGYEDLSQAISDTQLALKAVVASQGQMGAEDPLLRVSVQYMETQLKGLVLTTDSLCHFQTSHKVNQQKVMDRVDVVECDLDSLLHCWLYPKSLGPACSRRSFCPGPHCFGEAV